MNQQSRRTNPARSSGTRVMRRMSGTREILVQTLVFLRHKCLIHRHETEWCFKGIMAREGLLWACLWLPLAGAHSRGAPHSSGVPAAPVLASWRARKTLAAPAPPPCVPASPPPHPSARPRTAAPLPACTAARPRHIQQLGYSYRMKMVQLQKHDAHAESRMLITISQGHDPKTTSWLQIQLFAALQPHLNVTCSWFRTKHRDFCAHPHATALKQFRHVNEINMMPLAIKAWLKSQETAGPAAAASDE